MSKASTSYKKQDGTLAVSKDTVLWTPGSGGAPALSILISDVTNLQQTPEKSAKVSIRLAVQKAGVSAPENHTFNFTSNNARAEQVAITDILRKAIEAARAQNAKAAATPAPSDNVPSAAMAIAQAVSSGVKAEDSIYDDAKLMTNVELQKSLLNANPQLRQRFDQSLREKPDAITITQFSTQFWATRVHLLRAHAVEKSQAQGTYNVLSEVKPKNIDGTAKLNLSKEQIQLIFSQHPLVKRVYDDNVPQLNEKDFWARFFASRLFKKLKGEKITDADSHDPKLDRYLSYDEVEFQPRYLNVTHIPHFIDLEGNEQNHSQRKGNRPDWTMQPNSHDKVPILRVLNNMSEKMMAEVTPADEDLHAPAGMDENTYNELRLRDLQMDDDDNRIMLKIADQKRFMSRRKNDKASAEAILYAKQAPDEVLRIVRGDMKPLWVNNRSNGGIKLDIALGVLDSDSEDEDAPKKAPRIGSRSSRTTATSQIIDSIKQRRSQAEELSGAGGASVTSQAPKLGLSTGVMESLIMTHNTTVEFLHYFWTVFLSGDESRAAELQKLVEALDKSTNRINAVADMAEKERMQRVEKARATAEEYFQRTGKRLKRHDPNLIKGGAKTVKQLTAPTSRAIKDALEQYSTAWKTQMAQVRLAQEKQENA